MLYKTVTLLLVIATCLTAAPVSGQTPAEKKELAAANADYTRSLALQDQGKYSESARIRQNVLTVKKRILGEEHPAYAQIVNDLGVTYHLMCDFERALPQYLEAKRLRKKILGKDHIDYAQSVDNLALLYRDMGSFDGVETLHLEAIRIRKKMLGKSHPVYARSINNLGTFYFQTGAYDRAEQLISEAIAIRKKIHGKEHFDYAVSVYDLARIYKAKGANRKAEPLFLEALNIEGNVLGKEHPSYAHTLNQLAQLYQNLGAYERAEEFYLRAKNIREKALGKKHPEFADSLNDLADLYRLMDSLERAEELYRQAKKIREETLGKMHPDYAATLNSLGLFYYDVGSFELAEPLILEAKKIKEEVVGEEHPDYARSLISLATLYDVMGEYGKAEPLYLEAKKIYKKVLGAEHPHYSHSLNNLAAMYFDMGSYERSLPLHLEANKIYEKTLGKRHPDYARSLANIADLYRATGEFQRAESLFLESIKIFEKAIGKENSLYTGNLNKIAGFYLQRGKNNQAVRYMDLAQKSRRSYLVRTLPVLDGSQRKSFLSQSKSRLALSIAYHTRANQRAANLSAGWLLNSKGMLQESEAEAALLSNPDANELVLRLRLIRKQLAELTLSLATETTIEKQERLVELENQQTEVNQELAAYRLNDVGDPWINIGTVRGNLPFASVMINIAKFKLQKLPDGTPERNRKEKEEEEKNAPAIYVAWIIPALGEGNVRLIPLGDAKTIEAKIAALREQLTYSTIQKMRELGEERLEKEFIRLSKDVSNAVIGPLESYLADFEEIIVSPDGELWTIPWELLRSSNNQYLLEKFRVRYLISGRELATKKRPFKSGISQPVVFADPAYDLNPGEIVAASKVNYQTLRSAGAANFARLPSSRVEANSIKSQVEAYTKSSAKMLLGSAARESTFKQLHRPRSLVVSTHGYFDKFDSNDSNDVDVNPLLRCGLALAGANNRKQAMKEGKEDGILTGLEIVGTDLRGTELVVLSACETGLGKITSGEGVSGLRQAFQLAGAQSVVSSLWQVEDGETARLMKLFFQNLAEGKTKSQALREAQLTRIKARRARHGAAHPFFWAAFTLTGQD